jgi:hypothetical protein
VLGGRMIDWQVTGVVLVGGRWKDGVGVPCW